MLKPLFASLLVCLCACSHPPPSVKAPLVIIYLHQCGRPLGLVGVDTEGSIHILDATEMSEAQIQLVANTVPVNRFPPMDVPCVSHHKDALPSEF